MPELYPIENNADLKSLYLKFSIISKFDDIMFTTNLIDTPKFEKINNLKINVYTED